MEPPLPFDRPAFAARQLGHDALGVHAAGQHMAVVAIGRDALVALFGGSLQPDNDRLLPDIKMAEAADQPHAVKLARLFLESADEQHITVIGKQFFFRCI